ncbi:unnamed protein product [Alopecurus aequalis]
MRKCTFLLAAIAALIYAIATPVAGCGVSDGKKEWNTDGWEPIKDINDKHIQELGGWAVSEFLRWMGDSRRCMLKFNKVVSGKKNFASDLKYELVIDSPDNSGNHGKHTAQLYEEGLTKTPKLISFTNAD